MLRFLADSYDDTCSTVFPLLSTILGSVSPLRLTQIRVVNPRLYRQYKRARKVSSGPLNESTRSFLVSLMDVILTKLKWDENPELDDADEDDTAEFEKMRKVGSFPSH